MNIGDLFVRVLADMKEFQAQAVKEGEKAGDAVGKSMSERIGATLKTKAVAALGAGLAGAFAIATKGALELENATARYRAETGATAEAAAAMGKVINKVAGDNRMSLESVTDIAIHVKNDMGAVGAEAAALTDKFAKFARVTRQDGVASVKAFDDILDSWGLTAGDTGKIMDKLIVSQRKFGGDLNETESTLASLAPAMKAANMNIDDGIALLGLFGSKGLDANTAAAAFAKSLTKVKSPKELQDLITDISNTKDPFLRAAKAADVFGAKAGAKLANALAGANLDDFKISVEESAGALQDAADVIDNTWSGRVQKAISQATAGLREFGAAFGPALTGTAALASLFLPLAKALGAGKLLTGLAKFPLLFKNFIVKSILAAIIPATIAGEAVGVGASEGVATGMAGGKAAGIANKVLGPLGKVWGSILGKGFVLGALAVIGIELWQQLEAQTAANKEQTNQIGVNVGKEIATGTGEGLQQSKAALEKGIADLDLMAMLFGGDARNAQNALKEQLAKVNDAIESEARAQALKAGGWGGHAGDAYATGYVGGINHKQDEMSAAQEKAISDAADASFKTALAEGKAAGAAVITGYAQGLLDKQSAVKGAFEALQNQQKTELTRMQEVAYTIGVLTSKSLADGLNDSRPGVRLMAEQVEKDALGRLHLLVKDGRSVGAEGMEALKAGLHSKNPAIRKEAQIISKLIDQSIKDGKTAAGKTAGDKINAGLKSKKDPIHKTAYQIGVDIVKAMYAGIAAGRGGGFGGSGGGYNPFKAGGGQVIAGRTYVVNENSPTGPELFRPAATGTIIPLGPSGAGASNLSVNVTINAGGDVSAQTARRFGQSVLDVVADGLREQTARSV